VLCSVADPAICLREVRRVLRDGGKFVFVEHVAADSNSTLCWAQRVIKPVWSWVGGGCNPARNTAEFLLDAGFSNVRIEEFRLPLGVAAPHIAGVAIR